MVNESRSMKGNLLLGTVEGSYKGTTKDRGGEIDPHANHQLGVLDPGTDRQAMPPVAALDFPAGSTWRKQRPGRQVRA